MKLMILSEHGNAIDCIDMEPTDVAILYDDDGIPIDTCAVKTRTVVTIGPSPFITGSSAEIRRCT